MRIGIGFDMHPFATGRRLMLGGVEVPHEAGLAGHSDADVLLHAVMDALLGAAALGDIGQHFPSDDPQWKDADSRDLLRRVVAMLRERGHAVGNIDATVIAQEPRLAPHIEAMRAAIAEDLGVAVDCVSVKATTTDGLGAIGRGEGVAALAVALLQ